jgi:basic membrane protein A and related proteins
MKHLLAALLAASASLAGANAQAAEIKPAVIFDLGGKFDKSFNESAFNGAERFKTETGTSYREFEIQNESQREQVLRRFARDGHTPIVAVGFAQQAAVEAVSKDYPDLQFAIIDTVAAGDNVRSILFREEEGSYLVGMLAGLKSQSGTVGFVGGMDIPLIRNFACGYKGGVMAAKADAKYLENMTGTTAAAWNDPVRGGELARAQIDQGADVIFHAAGATGVGVLQAAADAGKFGIGVDSNQNMLHPGRVLTSMVKRVDNAVYQAFADAAGDKWTAGTQVLGLKEDGVGYAVDDNNRSLLTPEMTAAVEKAKADIVAGTIKVHNYTTDNTCPY